MRSIPGNGSIKNGAALEAVPLQRDVSSVPFSWHAFAADAINHQREVHFFSCKQLGWKDSNLRVAVPKTAALPLGYTP